MIKGFGSSDHKAKAFFLGTIVTATDVGVYGKSMHVLVFI
jgi:hypothetical protein